MKQEPDNWWRNDVRQQVFDRSESPRTPKSSHTRNIIISSIIICRWQTPTIYGPFTTNQFADLSIRGV